MATKQKVFGNCCVCGEHRQLSFEHVPPQKAFNDRGVLLNDMEHHFKEGDLADPRQMRKRRSPKGMGRNTLCEPCNNLTGGLYGTAYIDWAYQGMAFRNVGTKCSILALPFRLFPGRVGKQIMCMFASACGPSLFRKHPELPRYVLNRDHRGIPSDLRLYCFLMSRNSSASRQTGVTGLLTGFGGFDSEVHMFAEISFPPFGYILTVDSRPKDSGLLDITAFTHFGYHDYRTPHLKMPVREVASYFPGDFRRLEEWNAVIEEGLRQRALGSPGDLVEF